VIQGLGQGLKLHTHSYAISLNLLDVAWVIIRHIFTYTKTFQCVIQVFHEYKSQSDFEWASSFEKD